jgi:hypothetical protein
VKGWAGTLVVVVSGALLGSFLGKFVALAFPNGRIHDLFATDISAGLSPTNLDLRIIDLTFGCMFRFNVMSVVGIVLAALLYKKIFR